MYSFREVCAPQLNECLRSIGCYLRAPLCAPFVSKGMEHVVSAEVSTHALLQPVNWMAEAVCVCCSTLRDWVRERMLRQRRDARQKHSSRLRLSTKSEMQCTQFVTSGREPRLTWIGVHFNGPEEIVSDILCTRRTATLRARLHSSMAYSDWRRETNIAFMFCFCIIIFHCEVRTTIRRRHLSRVSSTCVAYEE